MKRYLSLILTALFVTGLTGCGDNKTAKKLLGTDMVVAPAGASSVASTKANSVKALYKSASIGAGAGAYSAAPGRFYSSARGGLGLGTPNSNGEYTVSDTSLGMTSTIKFVKSGQTVYMDLTKVISGTSVLLYTAQDITGTGITLTSYTASYNPATSPTVYVPAFWLKASNNQPIAWLTATTPTAFSGMEAFFTATSYPDSMVNTVSGSVPGGTISMTLTSAMPSTKPTDANPATMTGNGTIKISATGETLTVTASLSIGASGPVGGTQSFTSTSGESGVMTYSSDGSMTGTVSKGGLVVATITISSSGSGTYTDKDSGKTYSITGAKPS